MSAMLHKQGPECPLIPLQHEEKNMCLLGHWSKETETGGADGLPEFGTTPSHTWPREANTKPTYKHIYQNKCCFRHCILGDLLCNIVVAVVDQRRD